MLNISNNIQLADWEIEITPIRAQGSGGQNVNKVSSAVHLRFDIKRSSLPIVYKERLLQLSDQKISKAGVVVIKAQNHRTLEKNKEDALQRLTDLIRFAGIQVKKRQPTRSTRGAQQRRMDKKTRRGRVKVLRGRVND